MFVQYRHVQYGEEFWYVNEGVNIKYVKTNHGRARISSINSEDYKGRPTYRTFRKNQPVLVLWTRTEENKWMEVECQHDVVPFDNDKQCVHCGEELKGAAR